MSIRCPEPDLSFRMSETEFILETAEPDWDLESVDSVSDSELDFDSDLELPDIRRKWPELMETKRISTTIGRTKPMVHCGSDDTMYGEFKMAGLQMTGQMAGLQMARPVLQLPPSFSTWESFLQRLDKRAEEVAERVKEMDSHSPEYVEALENCAFCTWEEADGMLYLFHVFYNVSEVHEGFQVSEKFKRKHKGFKPSLPTTMEDPSCDERISTAVRQRKEMKEWRQGAEETHITHASGMQYRVKLAKLCTPEEYELINAAMQATFKANRIAKAAKPGDVDAFLHLRGAVKVMDAAIKASQEADAAAKHRASHSLYALLGIKSIHTAHYLNKKRAKEAEEETKEEEEEEVEVEVEVGVQSSIGPEMRAIIEASARARQGRPERRRLPEISEEEGEMD